MVNDGIKKLAYGFLWLLSAAIAFSPRLSLGYLPFTGRSIDIRAEDLIILAGVWLGAMIFLAGGYRAVERPPLFWPIAAWLLFGLVSVLINSILGGGNPGITFFYFLKEIEFFVLYLLVFYCVRAIGSPERIVRWWMVFGLLNMFWIFFVFFFHISRSILYGPDIFAEPQGPFPSGGFLLMLFIFFAGIAIFSRSSARRTSVFVLCGLLALGVIASGSSASFFGLAVSLFLLAVFYLARRLTVRRFAVVVALVVLAAAVFSGLASALHVHRVFSIAKISYEYDSGNALSRLGILRDHMTQAIQSSPLKWVIGMGIYGEAHSQYVRVFLERGMIGLLLFAWLIGSILRIAYRGIRGRPYGYQKGMAVGLFVATISMLVMSIPDDAFMTVKPAETYWFFAAMAMAALVGAQKESPAVAALPAAIP